jgi:hypothetical protein
MTRSPLSRLIRAWLLTSVVDAIFSSVLVGVFYGSTVARLWQGVAATVLGPSSFEGGARTVAIGLLMHAGVAFAWSAVFLALFERFAGIRRVVRSPGGVLKVAAVYGPCIWLVMSFLVIPTLVHRPPTLNYRWFIQLIGHIPFVAVPIVYCISRGAGDPRDRS